MSEAGPTQATCIVCGGSFPYDPVFYSGRSLAPPRRCQRCRDDRRGRLVATSGRVAKVWSSGAFVVDGAGRAYFAPDLHAPVGWLIAFAFDPDEAPPPGRRPIARDAVAVGEEA